MSLDIEQQRRQCHFNGHDFVISDRLTYELIQDHDGDDVSASELVERVSVAAFALLLAAKINYRRGREQKLSRSRFPLHEFEASAA